MTAQHFGGDGGDRVVTAVTHLAGIIGNSRIIPIGRAYGVDGMKIMPNRRTIPQRSSQNNLFIEQNSDFIRDAVTPVTGGNSGNKAVTAVTGTHP